MKVYNLASLICVTLVTLVGCRGATDVADSNAESSNASGGGSCSLVSDAMTAVTKLAESESIDRSSANYNLARSRLRAVYTLIYQIRANSSGKNAQQIAESMTGLFSNCPSYFNKFKSSTNEAPQPLFATWQEMAGISNMKLGAASAGTAAAIGYHLLHNGYFSEATSAAIEEGALKFEYMFAKQGLTYFANYSGGFWMHLDQFGKMVASRAGVNPYAAAAFMGVLIGVTFDAVDTALGGPIKSGVYSVMANALAAGNQSYDANNNDEDTEAKRLIEILWKNARAYKPKVETSTVSNVSTQTTTDNTQTTVDNSPAPQQAASQNAVVPANDPQTKQQCEISKLRNVYPVVTSQSDNGLVRVTLKSGQLNHLRKCAVVCFGGTRNYEVVPNTEQGSVSFVSSDGAKVSGWVDTRNLKVLSAAGTANAACAGVNQ